MFCLTEWGWSLLQTRINQGEPHWVPWTVITRGTEVRRRRICGNIPPGTLSVKTPSPRPLGVSQVPVCQSLSVERTLSTKPLACMGEHMVSAPQQLLADDKRHVRSFLCTPDVQDGAIRQGSVASRAPCLCPWELHSRHSKGTVPTSERFFRGTSSSCVL